MKRKIGIVCNCIAGEDPSVTLQRIKKIGFDSFFSDNTDLETVRRLKECADGLGLEYEFIHAPFFGINSMWVEGESYRQIFDGMTEAIDSAAACGVPMVITHTSSGWTPPPISDLGLSRFDRIVAYAKEKGVVLAFENLRMIGNTAYFTERYEHEDCVRFCYDCGHEHCYTKTVCWPDIFCHRMVCTHIHDNFGRGWVKDVDGDLHLLPFDGTVDYEKMMRKLDEYEYAGSLMLEVYNGRPEYAKLSADEFLETCYERILKISKL